MRNVSFLIGSAFSLSLLASAALTAPASADEEIVLSPDHGAGRLQSPAEPLQLPRYRCEGRGIQRRV